MRAFWEQVGMLGPVYRLASRGLDDRAIAVRLKMPELQVHNCLAWLLRCLGLATREELVLYANPGQRY